MPPLRQPHSLQFLAKYRLEDNISQIAQWIIERVDRRIVTFEDWNLMQEDVGKAFKSVTEYLAILPVTLLDQMLLTCIYIIDDVLCLERNMILNMFVRQEKSIVANMERTWSHLYPTIREFDLTLLESRCLKRVIIGLLHILPKLQILKLPNVENYETVRILSEKFIYLPQLKVLEFQDACTDHIIQSISLYCANVQVIIVDGSFRVTDESVPFFLKLENVSKLDLYNTMISTAGGRQILSGMPKLESICWDSEGDQDIFAGLPCDILTNIKTVEGNYPSFRTIVDKCPNLQKLRVSPVRNDLTPIMQLKSIENLHLENFSYRLYDNSNILLTTIGENLKVLRFDYVDFLNIGAIVKNCVSLKQLTITSSIFSDDEVKVNLSSPHFKSLQSLTLENNKWDETYIVHLIHYTSLKELSATGVNSFDDDYFTKLIRNGGLKEIEIISIDDCGFLSLSTVEKLIDFCPALKSLSRLYSWKNVTSEDVRYINDKLKKCNYDVWIS